MPKLTVLLSDDEYRRFDTYCRKTGYKKSPLVARLVRDHLLQEGFALQSDLFPPEPVSHPKRRRKRHA